MKVRTEYNEPRKMMVGMANENAIFLYTGCKLPNAGAVMYWLPGPHVSRKLTLRSCADRLTDEVVHQSTA